MHKGIIFTERLLATWPNYSDLKLSLIVSISRVGTRVYFKKANMML